MNSTLRILVISVFILTFPSSEVLAGRGGGRLGGGGARMGGGGARMGGGGGARPNFSAHAPSMSRAAPLINRPNINRLNINRPNVNRPNVNRPNINASRPNNSRPDISRPNVTLPKPGDGGNRPSLGSGNRPSLGNGNRPNIGGANGPTFGDRRPSHGQLDDFLGIPGGANRPTPLPGKQPDRSPGNIGVSRPDRPNVGNIRDNVGSGNTNIRDAVENRVANVGDRDININAGNRVNIGNRFGDNHVSSIRDRWSNNVNRPFGNTNFWDPGFSRNPNAWRWQHSWNRYPPNWGWRVGTWASVGTFFAWNWVTPTPVVYDYGTSVVYRDNDVYVQDQPVATADEYYVQASTIAENVPTSSDSETIDPETIDWMPLGVFAISAEQATDTGMLIQLAVSKEGMIAGTFYNETTDSSRPVEGTVDRESQRVAWKFADSKNEEVVMETVIHNLTEDESTALVHFGADKQETWTMLRMEKPKE